MITLYIKTHNKTGLKYFGKTIQDPYKYKGSGVRWKKHIKKYGYDVNTEIFAQFENETDELSEVALMFSEHNDIVNSDEWANLMEENGLDGGSSPESIRKMLITRKDSSDGKSSYKLGGEQTLKTKKETFLEDGRSLLQATVEKTAETRRARGDFKKLAERHAEGDFWETKKCEFCEIEVTAGNFQRWHGENCKFNTNNKRKIMICPHCKKEGSNNMRRYHFDNCKMKDLK